MSINKFHSSLKNSLIQAGRLEEWSRFIGGGFENTENIGIYRVQIQDENQDIRIFIWSRIKPCVNIVMSKHDKVAVLDGIYYNPGCTIDGKMKRGEGTRKMVQFAINFIKSKGAKEIQLMDKSSVYCKDKHIRLGPMYFFKFGQTWYEKYFGFLPNEKYATKYEEAKIRAKQKGLENKPCDYFTDDIIDNLLEENKMVFFTNIVWCKKL